MTNHKIKRHKTYRKAHPAIYYKIKKQKAVIEEAIALKAYKESLSSQWMLGLRAIVDFINRLFAKKKKKKLQPTRAKYTSFVNKKISA